MHTINSTKTYKPEDAGNNYGTRSHEGKGRAVQVGHMEPIWHVAWSVPSENLFIIQR